MFTTYLYHTCPPCFGVSHTIFRKNLRIPYSKSFAFSQLLSTVHWLSHNMKDTSLLVYNIFPVVKIFYVLHAVLYVTNFKNLCFCRSC